MGKRSIRFRLTFFISLVLIGVVGITFFTMRFASGMVLKRTIRDYLISTVEENVGEIRYKSEKDIIDGNTYIDYEDGYLEIDLNFMDVVNDVHAALYREDGTLIYGENPLSVETEKIGFTDTYTFSLTANGIRYDIYDRRLNMELPGGESLWIRGIVPETKSESQLSDITAISLILLSILIILAVTGGYFLIKKLLSPLRRIETEAEEISKGDDLDFRFSVEGQSREIASLSGAFNNMLDRLSESFEAEKEFTSDVSHELRTPTAVILAQTEYTLEKERDKDEYIEALTVVEEQGRKMKDLIGDMLDMSRMSRGTDKYELEQLDLSSLADDVCSDMDKIGIKNISLRRDIEKGIYVKGNRLLLERLLKNLINNAYSYGKEGGNVWVSLNLDRESKRAVIKVADDGIGMTEEECGKIFERFYRSQSSREIKGTGLGLAMVKRITELHKGSITVKSAPGEGSQFTVEL